MISFVAFSDNDLDLMDLLIFPGDYDFLNYFPLLKNRVSSQGRSTDLKPLGFSGPRVTKAELKKFLHSLSYSARTMLFECAGTTLNA